MSEDVFLQHGAHRNHGCNPRATIVTGGYGNFGCMNPANALPERLETALKAAKKGRADLIKATGLSRQAVNKWFEGESANLRMQHLFAVADELGVEARWLAIGNGEMMREDQPHSVHGVLCTREGAQIGAEWDKIEGDEYKQLAHDFMHGLVAAQKRAAAKPGAVLAHPQRLPGGEPKLPAPEHIPRSGRKGKAEKQDRPRPPKH